MIVRAAQPIQTTNHWKNIAVFLIVFIIASDAFLIYKLIDQSSTLNRQQQEITHLLSVVSEYQKKESNRKAQATAKEPELIKKTAPKINGVTKKEFLAFKKVYEREIRRLKREIDRIKKSAVRVQ